MIWVDCANSLFDPLIKVQQSCVFFVGRLIQWIVASNPSVMLVVLGKEEVSQSDGRTMLICAHFSERFPNQHCTILKIFVHPDYMEKSSAATKAAL